MKCEYCRISREQNAAVLSLCRLGPGTLDPSCAGCCSHFCSVLRRRLPGGFMFREIQPYLWEFRHGARVSVLRMLYALSPYFLGGHHVMIKRPIGELRPPYPPLYHFTPAANRDSILARGLLSNRGRVYLTNWQDARWTERLRRHQESDVMICFQIDAERLVAAGHRINIINRFHEYVTDHVPPDCLTLTDLRVVGPVGDP